MKRLSLITSALTNQASTDKTYADAIVSPNSSDSNLKSTLTAAGQRNATARSTLEDAVTVALTTDVENVIAALTGIPRP